MSVWREGYPKESAVAKSIREAQEAARAKLVQDLAERIITEFKHRQFGGAVLLDGWLELATIVEACQLFYAWRADAFPELVELEIKVLDGKFRSPVIFFRKG